MEIYLFLFFLVLILWFLLHKLRLACEQANQTDWGGKWVNRLDGLNRLLCYKYHRLNHEPIQLPETGGAIIVANHISGLDPLLIGACVKRPLRFMVAREEYERFGLRWFFRITQCIPVDRDSRPEIAFREALNHLKAGEVIVIFPHGKLHLPTDPPRKPKAGAVRLSALAGVPVFPFHISGIAGMGHVLPAVYKRSHAFIQTFPVMHCDSSDIDRCLEKLAEIIDRKVRP
ncbi:MAG: 1-acyl-sn-glycerol-3-phosphate acyltransferase [Gammaproteobacteria bacterium]|nr:1-acyl-sn-glycerol-3-phosphate acyltransferase [Gammaproteobacteria bacterium]MDH5593575.1 1-acyl-sn-glycerol-3-phosphate acyltransferase [Gammaproteobacteria bacterium]